MTVQTAICDRHRWAEPAMVTWWH